MQVMIAHVADSSTFFFDYYLSCLGYFSQADKECLRCARGVGPSALLPFCPSNLLVSPHYGD